MKKRISITRDQLVEHIRKSISKNLMEQDYSSDMDRPTQPREKGVKTIFGDKYSRYIPNDVIRYMRKNPALIFERLFELYGEDAYMYLDKAKEKIGDSSEPMMEQDMEDDYEEDEEQDPLMETLKDVVKPGAISYKLDFISDEYTVSEQTRVAQHYEFPYSKIAQLILKDYLKVPAKKLGIFTESQGIRSVIIPTMTPLNAITWCSKRALDVNGKPTFLFFEKPIFFQVRCKSALFKIGCFCSKLIFQKKINLSY
jgi:hypothetical protein